MRETVGKFYRRDFKVELSAPPIVLDLQPLFAHHGVALARLVKRALQHQPQLLTRNLNQAERGQTGGGVQKSAGAAAKLHHIAGSADHNASTSAAMQHQA